MLGQMSGTSITFSVVPRPYMSPPLPPTNELLDIREHQLGYNYKGKLVSYYLRLLFIVSKITRAF